MKAEKIGNYNLLKEFLENKLLTCIRSSPRNGY